MLRWVTLAVAVVALTAAATLVAQYRNGANPTWDLPAGDRAGTEGPQPLAEVDGSHTHEFGPMSTQKTGTHKWTLTNKGQGDLAIWLAGSTCMCTIAKLKQGEKATIKPGESTEIEVEWKTKDSVGEFNKGVSIGTSDTRHPEIKLNVHGLVHNPVVIVPQPQDGVISVGNIMTDETKETSLAVFSPDQPALKLTKLTSSKPDLIVAKTSPLSAEDRKGLNTGGGYRLDIQLKPGMPLGSFREEVIVETDNPDQPKLTLTLVGFAAGPISVMPSNVRIVTINGKDGGSGQVTLLVREGRPINFKVAHKPDKIEVSITPNDTPSLKGRYRLNVIVPPGTAAVLIDDEIVLQTDHPKVRELKIPVNIVVGSG
jgi:hypothetical protein